MSLATRRRASARWSWCSTSSARRAGRDDDAERAARSRIRMPRRARAAVGGVAGDDEHAPRARRRRGSRSATSVSCSGTSGTRSVRKPPARSAPIAARRSTARPPSRRGSRADPARAARPDEPIGTSSPAAQLEDRRDSASSDPRSDRAQPLSVDSRSRAEAATRGDDRPAIRPSSTRRVRRRLRRLAGRALGDPGRRPGVRLGAATSAAGRRWPARAGSAAARGLAALGRGEEPLEVAQPVAPVAPRVDPVVAQAARRRSTPGPCSGARQGGGRPS